MELPDVWESQRLFDETASLADPRHRRDRAAPVTRRLAAGVGGRVALPRRVAGRVGQARLAKQTRSAARECRPGLGCPAVTARKIGGGNVSTPAVRRREVVE